MEAVKLALLVIGSMLALGGLASLLTLALAFVVTLWEVRR